jgi:hypothetical protein
MFTKVTIKIEFSTEVINQMDGDDIVDADNEIFKEGEIFEVDLLSENLENIHVQFGDGSIAFLPKDFIEIEEMDENN